MNKIYFSLRIQIRFLFLCLWIGPLSLYAQEQTQALKGLVKTADGSPASGVTIRVQHTNISTASDAQGHFVLQRVPNGEHQLEISLLGFKTLLYPVQISTGQQAAPIEIRLEATARELEEVTVTSGAEKFAKKESEFVARMPLKNLENPQVYTVVPKELFIEQNAVDLQTALMAVPGLSNITLGVGSGGTGLSMRMRGFSGADGAGSIRNGMATNFVSLSDPANLESIEVIKGPSATLFGSTLISYGGLVNRVTKRPMDVRKGEIGFSFGSFGLGRFTADYNTPLNEDGTFLFRINTALHREKSFQDFGVNKTNLIAPAFTYKPNSRLTLDFDFELFNSERTTTYVALGSIGTALSNINELNWDFKKSYTTNELTSKSKVFNAFGKATYKLSDSWTSQTAVSYANTDNNANYLFLLVNSPDSIGRRIMNIPSMFTTNQVQQNFIGDFHLGELRNRLVFGLDYTQLTTTDRRATLNPYDKVALNGANVDINIDAYHNALANAPRSQNKRNQRTYSTYLSDVLNVTPSFLVMASLRLDHFENVDNFKQTTLSPKLGLVYQLIPDQLSLFGNFMDGFQNVAPSLTQASPFEPVNFKPEHAQQWEGGVKFEFVEGRLNGTLSYYDIRVKNRVRYSSYTPEGGSPVSVAIQDGTQRNKGFEADLIATPFRGMHVMMGYGYNDSEYTEGDPNILGKTPYSSPKHVGNLWLSYRFMDGVMKGMGVGFGGNASSKVFWDDANTVTIPGYVKYDATIFYDVQKYRLGLKLNNLTNKEYWSSSYYALPQPTRQFILNFAYRF